MCGIAGIVHTDGREVDGSALARMSACLTHRGPDGSGVWTAGQVGFAHRRLAIIDLDGGRQPMHGESGCVLTFNGEIFNFLELRQKLAADGARFNERSDTEVVLRAYERWGDGCVDQLQGMFAFAIWDPRERRVFAARDRLGIKPFYYRHTPSTFSFASELTAVVAADGAATSTLDDRSFEAYLRCQYVPAPRTIVDNVRQLPPASTISLTVDNGEAIEHKYWHARGAHGRPPTVSDLQDRLARTVRSHMVADVPVGALLSGGLDSSLVAAHMVRASNGAVHTFAVGFEDPALDERGAARQVAAHLGTVHHEHVVTDADAASHLQPMAAAMDQPLADYAALPTLLIAAFAAQHVKVVLTGEGADELFAGYGRYRRDRLLAPISRLRPAYQASHVFSAGEVAELLGRRPVGFTRSARQAGAGTDRLNTLLVRDIEGWLPDDLLVKVDRMTMRCSLEARVPFLDHEFVEFALSVPARHKLRMLHGPNKLLMRRSAAGLVPDAVAARPKRGFKPPLDSWFRGRLRAMAHDVLLASDAHLRARVDIGIVRRLLSGHDMGRQNGHRIWTLLVFELWSRAHGVG